MTSVNGERRKLVNVMLVLAVIALVAFSLIVGAGNSTGGEGEKFGGTDSAATDLVTEGGHEPWFEPLFQPDSGEVESGLFAVQAALGAGVLGYCIGRLQGRRRPSQAADAGPETSEGPTGSEGPTDHVDAAPGVPPGSRTS